MLAGPAKAPSSSPPLFFSLFLSSRQASDHFCGGIPNACAPTVIGSFLPVPLLSSIPPPRFSPRAKYTGCARSFSFARGENAASRSLRFLYRARKQTFFSFPPPLLFSPEMLTIKNISPCRKKGAFVDGELSALLPPAHERGPRILL